MNLLLQLGVWRRRTRDSNVNNIYLPSAQLQNSHPPIANEGQALPSYLPDVSEGEGVAAEERGAEELTTVDSPHRAGASWAGWRRRQTGVERETCLGRTRSNFGAVLSTTGQV